MTGFFLEPGLEQLCLVLPVDLYLSVVSVSEFQYNSSSDVINYCNYNGREKNVSNWWLWELKIDTTAN